MDEPLVLDRARRELRCGDRAAPLSKLQWRAMLVLDDHRGACVDKEDLVLAVYGEECPIPDQLLYALHRRLRDKIRSLHASTTIETAPGHGFILE